MGIYFQYVNDTKRQFFCVDPTGQDIKRYAVGRNIGSRLLHLLLVDDPEAQTGFERHAFLGSWIGDRVYVCGDDCTPNFDVIRRVNDDIGSELIESLAINAPADLHQYGGHDWLATIASGDLKLKLSNEARRSILRYLRSLNRQFPTENVDALIRLFRPSADAETDG